MNGITVRSKALTKLRLPNNMATTKSMFGGEATMSRHLLSISMMIGIQDTNLNIEAYHLAYYLPPNHSKPQSSV